MATTHGAMSPLPRKLPGDSARGVDGRSLFPPTCLCLVAGKDDGRKVLIPRDSCRFSIGNRKKMKSERRLCSIFGFPVPSGLPSLQHEGWRCVCDMLHLHLALIRLRVPPTGAQLLKRENGHDLSPVVCVDGLVKGVCELTGLAAWSAHAHPDMSHLLLHGLSSSFQVLRTHKSFLSLPVLVPSIESPV